MKANSLSINLFSSKCNKNCPYCISKMTGKPAYTEMDYTNFISNLYKVKTVAQNAQVSSIIITGKGEPLLALNEVEEISKVFNNFPLEIQTNGIRLEEESVLDFLYSYIGINTIAISIDSYAQYENMKLRNIFKILSSNPYNFNVRLTINLVDEITKNYFPYSFIEEGKEMGISQISFRDITIPETVINIEESKDAVMWIKSIDQKSLENFKNEIKTMIFKEGKFLRRLSFGAGIYMIEGISCIYIKNCIQENSNDEDIRSLVYWGDGHLSTSWYGSNYGRIF